jgi:hypothetical protein
MYVYIYIYILCVRIWINLIVQYPDPIFKKPFLFYLSFILAQAIGKAGYCVGIQPRYSPGTPGTPYLARLGQ